MTSIFDLEPEKQDLYSVLGCVDTSTPEQIKTEYKRLALQHHPDKSTTSTEFEKIQAAYDIVGDSTRRALYDKWKASSLMIPFADYAQLGTHSQTVHWQSLPTQLTLTKTNDTLPSDAQLKSIRLPPTAPQLPKVEIKGGSFWKSDSYNKFRNYEI
ncbi:DnaJ-domain-containing protein, partial [Backusella circina FSU 941]